LLVTAGEIGHLALQDFMALTTLPKGIVVNQLDAQYAVEMSYAMFSGEGVWSLAVLVLAMVLWVKVVYTSSREADRGWARQALLASLWFLLPAVWLGSPPVSQGHVLRQVISEVDVLNASAPVAAEATQAPPVEASVEGPAPEMEPVTE
jgi:hypothetical protein